MRKVQNMKSSDISSFRESYQNIINIYADKVFQLCFVATTNDEKAYDCMLNTFRIGWNSYSLSGSEKSVSTWIYKIAYDQCCTSSKKICENNEMVLIFGETLQNRVASYLITYTEISEMEIMQIIGIREESLMNMRKLNTVPDVFTVMNISPEQLRANISCMLDYEENRFSIRSFVERGKFSIIAILIVSVVYLLLRLK